MPDSRETSSGADAGRTSTDRASTQVQHQLEQRGVLVLDHDSPESRAELLTAVEAFERAVAQRGGDSFTNTPMSSRPDDPSLVVPPRGDDEDASAYARRIHARAAEIAPAAG